METLGFFSMAAFLEKKLPSQVPGTFNSPNAYETLAVLISIAA